MRFAGHAAINNPRDPNVHLLASLSLFALGNYQGAAAEAHAVAAGGVKVDWTSLIGFYNNDASAYTTQLRALESYITNASSIAALAACTRSVAARTSGLFRRDVVMHLSSVTADAVDRHNSAARIGAVTW